MESNACLHGTMLSIRSYDVKQNGIHDGSLSLTVDFSPVEHSTASFLPEKYAEFMREVAAVVNRWNGESGLYVTGEAVPETPIVRHEIKLDTRSAALLEKAIGGSSD